MRASGGGCLRCLTCLNQIKFFQWLLRFLWMSCSPRPRRRFRLPVRISGSGCGGSTAWAVTTAHAKEMGSDPTREPPFFFLKPRDAIQVASDGAAIEHPYPPMTKNYHYEVELVAALGGGGRDVPVERALDLVYGYAVGLDMTRRD